METKTKIDTRSNLVKCDEFLLLMFDKVGNLNLDLMKRTPYVALIGAIVGQKIKYTEAKKIRGNLFTKLGTNFTNQDVEKLDEKELSELGLTLDNIKTIKNLNEYLKKNELKLDKTLSKNAAGIGPWTVETATLVANPYCDVFPSGDLFLQNRLKRLYNLKRKPTATQAAKMAEKWKPNRGYVTWHLWRWF